MKSWNVLIDEMYDKKKEEEEEKSFILSKRLNNLNNIFLFIYGISKRGKCLKKNAMSTTFSQ